MSEDTQGPRQASGLRLAHFKYEEPPRFLGLIVAVGIHHPKGPAEKELVLADMKRFGEEQRKHEGLVMVTAVEDETDGCLIGMAIWETREHYFKAREEIRRTFKHSVDFSIVEDRDIQFLYGEPRFWG